MKKAVADKSKDSKKKQRPTNLGEHGFVHVKVIDGKTYRREVTEGRPLEAARCIGCDWSFKSEQGKASHERTCALAQMHCKEKQSEAMKGNASMCGITVVHPGRKKSRSRENAAPPNESPRYNLVCIPAPSAGDTEADGRMNNRGSAVRIKVSNEKKVPIMQFYEQQSLSVSAFVDKHHLAVKCKKYLSEGKDGWRHPSTRDKILKAASDKKWMHLKQMTGGKLFRKSPYQPMENDLHKTIITHRAKGSKVSQNFMQISAKQLIKTAQLELADTFKASDGWFQRFLKRKNIKFRKCKSGKKCDGELNKDKIVKVSKKVRKKFMHI